MPTQLTDEHIQALARDLLHELYEAEGESLDPPAQDDDDSDAPSDDDTDLYDTPPDEKELLYRAIEYAQECNAKGIDPEEGLHRLAGLASGEMVQKAWAAKDHPRGKNGRFIPKGQIEAAKSDPEKAKQLREQVKPEDADKLEAALSGKTDLRNARETKRDDTKAQREKVQASRSEAKRLAYKLQHDPQPGDYAALIPHLPALTHKELSYVRTMLSQQGATFGGDRKAEARRQRLLDFARGKQLEAANEGASVQSRDALVNEPPPTPDNTALSAAELHAERMRGWEADRPHSAAAQEARARAEQRLGDAKVDAQPSGEERAGAVKPPATKPAESTQTDLARSTTSGDTAPATQPQEAAPVTDTTGTASGIPDTHELANPDSAGYRSRKQAESAAADYGPHAATAKVGGKWHVVVPKLGGAPGQAAPQPPPGTVASLPDAEFAAKVQAVADAHAHGFPGGKVYIADVYDALKAEDPVLTREEFDRKLLDAHRTTGLTLSRADLVQLMHPDWVRRSEVKHPLVGEYHFVLAADKPRANHEPPSDEGKRAAHDEWAAQYHEAERLKTEESRAEIARRMGAADTAGKPAQPLSSRSFAGRADDEAPSEEEFAAAAKPASPAPEAKPKPAKPPKAPAVTALAKSPGADKQALQAFAAAAPSDAARSAILDAEHNVHASQNNADWTPAERRRNTVERLGAAWRDAVERGDTEGAAYAQQVLSHFGAELHGPKPGEVTEFSGKHHDSERSVFSGPVKVLRQPVVLNGADGSEHVATKGKVGPAEGASQSSAPELRAQPGGRLRFPDADDPHIDRVSDADVKAVVNALASSERHKKYGLEHFAEINAKLNWPKNRLAYALAAAQKRGLMRLRSHEGSNGRSSVESAHLFATEPDSHEHYGMASLAPTAGAPVASAPAEGADGQYVAAKGKVGPVGNNLPTGVDNPTSVGNNTPVPPTGGGSTGEGGKVAETAKELPRLRAVSDKARDFGAKVRADKLRQLKAKIDRLQGTADRAAADDAEATAQRYGQQVQDLQAKYDELVTVDSANFWLDSQHNDFGQMSDIMWDVLNQRRGKKGGGA